MSTVIHWLNLSFLNFCMVLLCCLWNRDPKGQQEQPFLAVQSCWRAHHSSWGASQSLSLQRLRFGTWMQRVEEATPLSVPGPQQKRGPRCCSQHQGRQNKIISAEAVKRQWHSNASVKKINIQKNFSKLNNPSYFSALRHMYQGTGKAVLCSHTIPFPASGSACSAHLTAAVSSPPENALKRGFSQWERLTSNCL